MNVKNGKIRMTVREFIQLEEDIDVYDDVCEEIAIAFCGPLELTEVGEEKFAEVLDYTIELVHDCRFPSAIVEVDDDDERTWKRRLRKAKEFFYSAAGYCSYEDYGKWFKEDK